MEIVVVGVDGSEASGVALEFAAEEAARRKGRLRVISVWTMPIAVGPEMIVAPEAIDAIQEETGAIVDAAVERATELQPEVPCDGVVLAGSAGERLVEEGLGAAVIVVGRRGHGGLAALLSGSVSRHVADHAPCPVVVVPPLTTK